MGATGLSCVSRNSLSLFENGVRLSNIFSASLQYLRPHLLPWYSASTILVTSLCLVSLETSNKNTRKNKDTRMTTIMLIWCLFCCFWAYFTQCFYSWLCILLGMENLTMLQILAVSFDIFGRHLYWKI